MKIFIPIFFIFLSISQNVLATTGKVMGATSCSASNCHGGVGNNEDQYTLWARKDKHAKAFDVLFSEKSQTMAAILGIPKAEESTSCLKCHGMAVPAEKRGPKFDAHDGVSCENCHGAAEKWLDAHTKKGATHEGNIKLGLIDNRDMGIRTQQCLSCHQGLSHQLYSAGHPEISFELDTYSAIMPQHWKNKSKWEGAKVWSMGQAAGFEAWLKILDSHIKNNKKVDESFRQCTSCHHNLDDVNYKLTKSWGGVPPADTSRYVALQAFVSTLSSSRGDELKSAFLSLEENLNKKFDEGAIVNATEKLKTLTARLKNDSSTFEWNKENAFSVLINLTQNRDAYYYGGYRAAEQALMALDAVYRSMAGEGFASEAIRKKIDELYTVMDLSDASRYEPVAFFKKLAELEAVLTGSPVESKIPAVKTFAEPLKDEPIQIENTPEEKGGIWDWVKSKL